MKNLGRMLALACLPVLMWTMLALAADEMPGPVPAPPPTTTDQPEGSDTSQKVQPGSPDEIICRREEDPTVGSRIGKRRKVCKPRSEWDAEEKAAEESLKNTQETGRVGGAGATGGVRRPGT